MSKTLNGQQVAVFLLMVALFAGFCPLRADEPFDYFHNSWSVIGLKDYENGTRVTPDNELLLGEGNKVRLRYGRDLKPLSRQ